MVELYDEIKKVSVYLTYSKDAAIYSIKKAEAEKKLKAIRKNFVHAKLYEFDMDFVTSCGTCQLQSKVRYRDELHLVYSFVTHF